MIKINKEMIKNTNENMKDDIVYFRNRIALDIDKLSKKSLRRLLKVYSGFSYANELIGKPLIKLNEEENKLLKQALTLQENCLGYGQLNKELNTKEGESNG